MVHQRKKSAAPGTKADPMQTSLERLAQALAADFPGHEAAWAADVDGALDTLEQALRQHTVGAEAANGLLTEIDLSRPSLVRRVSELRRQHSDFLEQTVALRKEVHQAAQVFAPPAETVAEADALPKPAGSDSIPDFGSLRRQGQQLLDSLRRHREEETDLTQESFSTDIGVGD
jgi:hypothetical protein